LKIRFLGGESVHSRCRDKEMGRGGDGERDGKKELRWGDGEMGRKDDTRGVGAQ